MSSVKKLTAVDHLRISRQRIALLIIKQEYHTRLFPVSEHIVIKNFHMRHALQLLPIVCRIRWQKCSRFGFFLIKVTRLVFPFGRIFCKARPCLHIFTRIQIEHHHLTEECFVLLFFVLQKLEQNFIPLNPVMCRLTVALCPVEIAELLEEIEQEGWDCGID